MRVDDSANTTNLIWHAKEKQFYPAQKHQKANGKGVSEKLSALTC
jgi:hypothetical protein